jgi:hypothetical protein
MGNASSQEGSRVTTLDPIHLASHSSRPRPCHVLLDVLDERLAWFRRQPWERQRLIDAGRFVPVEEMHAMLGFYLDHGFDEVAA